MTEPFVVRITAPRTPQERQAAQDQHQNLLQMLGINLAGPVPTEQPKEEEHFIQNIVSEWK
jgi:hypothetical protein